MNEKFMKIKRIAIPTLTVILIASQLFGCAATSQDETLNLIQKNDQIELEIAVPIDQEDEQGTQSAITWMELAYLDTYQETLRTPMEDTLDIGYDENINSKTGMLYELSDKFVPNNTLKGALQNKDFRAAVDNDEIITKLSDAAFETFIDLEEDEEMTNFYMAINAYFNLLPATEEGYANPQSALSRAEFMSLVMRAETPYKDFLKVDAEFESAVGKSEYNLYAQSLAEDSYLDLESKSLNEQTFNTSMSRAEAIYMLMNHYYADELKALDTSKAKLDDVKDGGDIATQKRYAGKDQAKAKELKYCISNPDEGVPTDIYKALVLAESKDLIDSETRFDEAITLEESIELLMDVYKSIPLNEETAAAQSKDTITVDSSGDVVYEGYNLGMTAGEIDKDAEDGVVGGDVYYNDDGTTYIIWRIGDEAGMRFEVGDTLPNNVYYSGQTEADKAKLREMYAAEDWD